MATTIYNEAKKRILNGTLDLDTAAIKVMLVKSTYTVDPDHAAIDDGSAGDPQSHELTVAGYSRQVLANRTVTKDNSADISYLDGDDTVFASLATGETIGAAIIFLDSGLDTTSIPIAHYPLPSTPTNGSNVTVVWASIAAGAILKA